MHIQLNYISPETLLFLYSSSLIITLSIINQYSKTSTFTTNIQYIKYQINEILQNPLNAKYNLFSYFFTMLAIFITAKIFYNPSSLFLFFGLTLGLGVQYFFEYNLFLLKIAYTIETKSISINKALKEKEWTIKRTNILSSENEHHTNKELKEKAKQLSFFKEFKKQSPFQEITPQSITFIDNNNDLYEIYYLDKKINVDKLEASLSIYYKNFYSAFNFSKKLNLGLIEAFFSSFVLYLSFKISF